MAPSQPYEVDTMIRSTTSRIAAATVIATAALAAASAVQAHTDVQLSIGIPARPVYVEPAPVYVQPRRVYVQPAPVYGQPAPVYVRPRPPHLPPAAYVYERPWASYDAEFERERAWRHAEWQRRSWHHRHHGGERSSMRGRDWD
jgi:hypothetical protein